MRLAHGWRLTVPDEFPREVLREFIRPAVRAVPQSLAERLGPCHITLLPRLADASLVSQWTATDQGLSIELTTEDMEPHDLAIEILVCLGQAFFEIGSADEISAYQRLLGAELEEGVTGEIDEDAYREKCALLRTPLTGNGEALDRFVRASLAATLAEYVHCLWHDVTIRTGPEHLPAKWLRRRLELLTQWFPADRGRSLFAEPDDQEDSSASPGQ